jgi:hypothetical protein
MCAPQSRHAYRWIAAERSTIWSLSPFSATLSLSRGTTATMENTAPSGFQHLVQPQTWLCADCAPTLTLTGRLVHWHTRVPPAKSRPAAFTPLSTAG